MQTESKLRYLEKRIDNTILAVKAARLMRGLSRRQVAINCGWTVKAVEQLENGRCNYTEERIRKVVGATGVDWDEFCRIKESPKKYLAKLEKDRTIDRKPRRNLYKVVTKEIRAIRILRIRLGISQRQASQICGYSKSMFSRIENGRTDCKRPRIEHVLKSFGYSWGDLERLVNSAVMRDEVMDDVVSDLYRLDDQAFNSAVNVIKALMK